MPNACEISKPLDGVRLVRVFKGGGVFGDPYTWSCVLLPTNRKDVCEMALVGERSPTPSEARAIEVAMRRLGITGYIRRDGKGNKTFRKVRIG